MPSCIEYIYELVIFLVLGSFLTFSSAWPLPFSQTVVSFALLLATHTHTHTGTHAYTHTHTSCSTLPNTHHSGWLIFINIEIVERLGFQLKAPFILPCLHLRIIAPLFSASVAECLQWGVLIALESLSLVIKKNDTSCVKAFIQSVTAVYATVD